MTTGFRILRTAALCLSLASLPLGVARAEADPAKVSAAREMGFQGVKDFEAGRFQEASDKLERAYGLVKAPTIGLWSARALVKLGKWVQAAERYLETTRLPLPETNRENHKKAQADAATERTELLPKIPKLKIVIEGSGAKEASVTLDGKVVEAALFGVEQPVDPGAHVVEAKLGSTTKRGEVSVAEAQSEVVSLSIEAGPREAEAPAAPEAPPQAGLGTSTGSPTLAYVALGVGGAGLVAGAVTGLMAMGKKSELEDSGHCRDGLCDKTVHDDLSSLNTLRTVSTVSFVVGAVGVGAGTLLLFTSGKKKSPSATRAPAVRVGVGHVSFGGTF